jgi:hypothetical protein
MGKAMLIATVIVVGLVVLSGDPLRTAMWLLTLSLIALPVCVVIAVILALFK